MAEFYRAMVVVPHTAGLPQDAIVNTWHFRQDPGSTEATDIASIKTQLDGFYTAWVPNCGSAAYTWSALNLKIYDLEDDLPRVPISDTTENFGTATANFIELAPEVACCLTLEGEKESGVNMRRRRGRVYLGPFSLNAPSDHALAPSVVYNDIAVAANTHFFTTPGATAPHIAVYSPYTHYDVPPGQTITHGAKDPVTGGRPLITPPRTADPANLLEAVSYVVKMWCDNGWDTQRRRGKAATTRLTVTL